LEWMMVLEDSKGGKHMSYVEKKKKTRISWPRFIALHMCA